MGNMGQHPDFFPIQGVEPFPQPIKLGAYRFKIARTGNNNRRGKIALAQPLDPPVQLTHRFIDQRNKKHHQQHAEADQARHLPDQGVFVVLHLFLEDIDLLDHQGITQTLQLRNNRADFTVAAKSGLLFAFPPDRISGSVRQGRDQINAPWPVIVQSAGPIRFPN